MIAMKRMKQSIIAVALLTAVSACGSAEESAEKFIDSGMALMSEGEYDKARLEFRNAIQINPTVAEPYYQLSLIDEKNQNWKEMYANLRAAESLDPENPKIILKLGQIEVVSGQLEEALASAEKVLAVEPDNIEALLLRANVRMKQENFGQAQKDINRAIEIDAKSLDALSYQVMIYKELKKYPEALSAAERALAVHPEAMPIKMIQLTIFDEQKNYQQMESLYRDIMGSYPNENWVVFSLVKLLNDALDRHEDAKNELRKYITANPEDTEAKIVFVSLVNTENKDQALNEMDKFIAEEPDNIDLRFARIDLLSQQGKTQQLREDLNAIVNSDPTGENGLRAKANLAALEASEDNFIEAEKLADEVLTIAPEDETALLLKAKLQLREDKLDAAISNLRILVRNNPNSDEALVLLGQAYSNSGSTQLAESSYRQALNANAGNVQAALAVSRELMQAEDYDRAERILANALGNNINNQELLQALAQVRILKQDWAGTGETIDKLNADGTSTAVSHLLSGKMYQGLEDYLLAIDEYNKALAINPQINEALQGLVNSYLMLNQRDKLIDYMNQHIQDHPELLNGYTVLASVYREQEEFEKAIEVTEKAIAQNPQWAEGYVFIANLHRAMGDERGALAALENGVETIPENNALSIHLASGYEMAGNYEKAREHYEKVLERDPSIDVVANNLASLLSDRFSSPENLERALTIANRFKNSDQPYFLDTYGWVNYKLGNYELARPALEKAVKNAADVPVFHYHLGRLYQSLEMNTESQEAFEKAESLANEQNDQDTLDRISKL